VLRHHDFEMVFALRVYGQLLIQAPVPDKSRLIEPWSILICLVGLSRIYDRRHDENSMTTLDCPVALTVGAEFERTIRLNLCSGSDVVFV
jgi:hypothetical protein